MLPYAWRLSISIVRAALGISCLTLFIVFSHAIFDWPLIPLSGFVIYSVYALWRSMAGDGRPFITLVIDGMAFMTWLLLSGEAAYGALFWLGLTSACYIFVLVEAVLTQEWPRVIAVVVVTYLLLLLVPYATAL